MKLWQIASGDTGRDYSDLFLRYDIMLLGPGDPGDFRDPVEGSNYHEERPVQWFVKRPSPGDIVLLRNGHEVRAVGRLPEGRGPSYRWNALFDDVLGWDLQHTRPVLWSEEATRLLDHLQPVFDNYKQQGRFNQVHEDRLTRLLPKLDQAIEGRDLRRPPNWQYPKEVPEEFAILDDEELGRELFEAGLSNDSVERVLHAIERIRRLKRWYWQEASGDRPSEMEAVAHMIIPLLLGLGWSEQLLAVEWRKIDLALFDRAPTRDENCVALLEAKPPGRGLGSAFEQAVTYVDSRGLQSCKQIILTDGARLLVYHLEDGEWLERPDGYVNLDRIRRKAVYPLGASGVETLIDLVPSRIHH